VKRIVQITDSTLTKELKKVLTGKLIIDFLKIFPDD
jgi:hypothetical protein